MPVRALPENPSLEHLKYQAKDLLTGLAAKDPAFARIPVVVITASGAVRERAGLLGVEEIVLKPIKLSQLLGAIAGATKGPRRLH